MMLVLVTVFFGLQYFRAKTNPQTVSPNAAASAPQSAPTSGTQPSAAPAPASTPAAGLPGSTAPVGPTVQASAESTTTVKNEFSPITFPNLAATAPTPIPTKYKRTVSK